MSNHGKPGEEVLETSFFPFSYREARIAALEKSIEEREKIIAECRGQNLKSIEELYVANRRCADLEAM